MSNRPSMLINLPPPPSDPITPNEHGPGTPNSTTTSLSALSVVAIKDGAVGQNHATHGHGHNRRGGPSANTLEAERADRISRLAGLERVSTVRATPSGHLMPGAGLHQYQSMPYAKDISTVGSASATDRDAGSVGGKTTWASQDMDHDYDAEDADKMSEDDAETQEHEGDVGDEVSSAGGFSDEDKASLVGFGEGAGSTVSGPVSTANARMVAARNNYNMNNMGVASPATPRVLASGGMGMGSAGSTPMSGIETGRPSANMWSTDAKMMEGISYEQRAANIMGGQLGTSEQPFAHSGGRFGGVGTEVAENVMRERIEDQDQRGMMTPPNNQSLGKFGFEKN